MFLFDPIHPVFSAIVETVAVRPRITIAELHEHLRKTSGMKVSVAHLYRIVTRMAENQILVKSHRQLSLNLMWVSYVEFIAGRAKRLHQHVVEYPLREGEKRVLEAHSLLDVEALWNHILVSLYGVTKEKQLYKYYSHAWWQLGRNAEEITFYKQLKERGVDCRWVFGCDTFLDEFGAKRVREVYEAVTTANPPFPRDGYNLNVYGEYIVECLLPEKIAKHFSFFFEKVKAAKEFDQELFLDIFSMRGKYKITVWRNPKQADVLRQKLRTYFERA
ncbi:MAG: hypothetical protein HOO67_05205 [Candidatus Peribacteraceae bacterium]|nr:hypothetical protein [Candidatus Peribacteraceae bacterium]